MNMDTGSQQKPRYKIKQNKRQENRRRLNPKHGLMNTWLSLGLACGVCLFGLYMADQMILALTLF
jgi:hypothetical protein